MEVILLAIILASFMCAGFFLAHRAGMELGKQHVEEVYNTLELGRAEARSNTTGAPEPAVILNMSEASRTEEREDE